MSIQAKEIEALDFLDTHRDESLERLFALLRVRSISTDPKYADYCREAAQMLVDELADLEFDTRLVNTEGHPIVVAHHAGSGPHVLFYGHYDVQPVDPVALWRHDPFDPRVEEREDRSKFISARGASDDKGQLRTFIEACRAWKLVAGSLPCRVSIFLEGEEESGSPNLRPFLEAHQQELSADVALICDTNMWGRNKPAITTSLRGSATGEVRIKGPSRDLHSGIYGGSSPNPLQILSNILSSLKDENGRVMLKCFYDGVQPITEEMKTSWNELGFDEHTFLADVGLSEAVGEKGLSVLEQTWSRPTAEINGISGGYTGEGFKTVIPSEAFAKISFRLVNQQDPAQVWASFKNHVQERLPPDCVASFQEHGGSRAVTLKTDSPAVQAVRDALAREWSTTTALMGSGGSIPVVNSIQEILGFGSIIMVGFAQNDDNIHSPNEKYELKSFEKGARSWVRILAALGTAPPN